MVSGRASPLGTQQAADRQPQSAVRLLGKTGLQVSAVGFGGYRVSTAVPAYGDALERALVGGVNLIDTSANYADGDSERLVGNVLQKMIDAKRIARNQVVVITKGGYLQGTNYALSQQRKQQGRPFAELVPYAEGLEHCIHPTFLEDQLSRSLERLGLETVDGYLLHNPEYYLGWAHKKGQNRREREKEYDRRIEQAFSHLEKEVARGRIAFYGISANTFPAPSTDSQFTALHKVWNIAQSISSRHHFKLVQMPFNLLEPGAVLERNQPRDRTVLALAREKGLGVLVNRPLNAIFANRMIRLADVTPRQRLTEAEIQDRLVQLDESERWLTERLLPAQQFLPPETRTRIEQQVRLAPFLDQQRGRFQDYDHWCAVRDNHLLPRLSSILSVLQRMAGKQSDLSAWLRAHPAVLEQALTAVTSLYVKDGLRIEKKISQCIAQADDEWGRPGTLSRRAIRCLISTTGVSAVLLGMRQKAYVEEALAEIRQPIQVSDRTNAWQTLKRTLSRSLGDPLATV